MPAIADINETLVRTYINRAVSDVFKTMLGREPTFSAQREQVPSTDLPPLDSHRPQVVGTVGFIGDVNGLIYLHLDLAFARVCTCHLLGMTEAELDEAGDDVINDAIGELTNMTVGSFKNGLCDSGYPCKLTIPSIVRGSNFIIEPISSASRHIYYFDCQEHRVVADILIQRDE
ncbi:MAG: chemotaxis protein CheX [Verrucomicrobia bacterium]|nr:chemotaxis protein CheX [Verrucomicrobiota bacterium]